MQELKLFGKSFVSHNDAINYAELQMEAMKVGYLVHPDCANLSTYNFIKSKAINYNSTFYKTIKDITSKSRFELLIDQIIHYCSTYGTNFESQPYIPNSNNQVDIKFTDYKVILPITNEEAIERCNKMLQSGIALSQETIEDILIIFDELNYSPNIDLIKNKECKMILCDKTNQIPTNNIEMLRLLVYKSTGKTLLIKNKESLFEIRHRTNDFFSKDVKKFGLEKMSEIFFRFKPIFLTFGKTSSMNKEVVNKLRRLADKHHKPMQIGFFESLLSKPESIVELPNKLESISNFKKVQILETINIRKKQLSLRAFSIRNGKLFMKEEQLNKNIKHYDIIYAIVYQSLITSLSKKKCSIKFSDVINLTIPTTEKSFIGNYPLGTSFNIGSSNAIVGIHWMGVDGANDLDLSIVNIDGKKFGWNASYYNSNKSIIYSGDMTSANPEAVELYYASNGFTPGIVKVNLYSGQDNSKFKLFFAIEKIESMKKNYMVDPNNVLFTIDSTMDSKEKSLGVLKEDKFILAQFRTGKGRVSGDSVTNKYTDYAIETLDCYLDLKKVLLDAGFTIDNKNPNLDLSNVDKDSLISLFS